MDIMKLTRELGRALQQDQTYINMSVAEQQCNEDEALQNAIGEFNLKRMAINNEAGKEDRSEELIEQYNKELREIYGRVMQNEHMAAYQAAKNEFAARDGCAFHVRGGSGPGWLRSRCLRLHRQLCDLRRWLPLRQNFAKFARDLLASFPPYRS